MTITIVHYKTQLDAVWKAIAEIFDTRPYSTLTMHTSIGDVESVFKTDDILIPDEVIAKLPQLPLAYHEEENYFSLLENLREIDSEIPKMPLYPPVPPCIQPMMVQSMFNVLRKSTHGSSVIGAATVGDIEQLLTDPKTGYRSTLFKDIIESKVKEDYAKIMEALGLLEFYASDPDCDCFDWYIQRLAGITGCI